ncbi:MAG TPA: hypothetical protein VNU70_12570 [Puia sp.]|nr:hypothetical protein [Puia sp.]
MDNTDEPGYSFDGFRVEFNEKIALLPLEKGEEPGLDSPAPSTPPDTKK